MGLLDFTDDPQTQGLLSLGLRLMSTPGKFGQAFGQAGQGALADMARVKAANQESKQAGLRDQLLQMQIAQAQQQQAQQAKLRELAQQSFESPDQAANFNSYAQGLAKLGDPVGALQMQQMLKKDTTPLKVGKDEVLLDPQTRNPIFSNVQPDQDPIAKLIAGRDRFPVGSPERKVYDAAIAKASTHQPATSVSVSMDKGFGDAFAKDAAGALAASRDKAKAAANTLQTLDRIEAAVNAGGVVTGPGAAPELYLRQLGEKLGIGGKDNAETLKRTRELIQGSAALAVDGAQMLAGQGQITEKERDLIIKASSVGQDLTVPEIQQLTGALRKVNRLTIERHQSSLSKVDKQFAPFVPFYQVDMPKSGVVDFGSMK